MNEKTHLMAFSKSELAGFVKNLGEPKYRAVQIFKNLHARRILSFDEMTDLPKTLRETLKETATLSTLTVESRYVSTDGNAPFFDENTR